MEFFIDSSNIQIKSSETINFSQLDPLLIYKYSNTSIEQLNKKLYYIIDFNINLNDYYLINNVKINLESNPNNNNINQKENNSTDKNSINNNTNINSLNDIILSQILFSYPDNINNNSNKNDVRSSTKYGIPYYYNPDKEDILLIQNNEISIFCIGATNHICFRFLVKKKIKLEEITVSKKYITKYIIYSQYIYSIPNATFLMTLLNLKNFFYNMKNNQEINKNNEIIKVKNNYYCSMYLTSISMIQARLFIQAWEMLTNLQNEILSFDDKILEKNKFLKIMFEINNTTFNNNNFGKNKNYSKEKKIYLTKLELIKAICMFEHGHIQIFLDCLKNSIDIFYYNKFVFLNKNISLNKINEIAQDKIHIQSILSFYGNQIVDILITFLKDKNEMILYSVLKIFEFFIDYNPVITFDSIHKIIDFVSKVSYTINYNKKKLNNSKDINKNIFNNYLIKDEDDDLNNNIILNNNNENENKIENIMLQNGLLYPYELYNNFKKDQKNSKEINTNNTSINRENINNIDFDINNNICKFNSISQILQKQINYTLDTIIQNIPNFDSSVINNILKTCSPFLFSIVKMADKDTLIYVCALKILKKCYENSSSNLYYMNYKNIFNLFLFGIKSNLKDIFKEYIKIQKNIYKNTTDLHTTKKLKENIKYINMKNNYISTLLNTNGIIENNDFGNLITIIFDRISEVYLHDFSSKNFSKNNNKLYGGINYISNCVKYIKVCLDTLKMINNNEIQNNNNDSDFLIFYLYLILEFLIIIYLPNSKNDIKKALLSFYLGKNSNEKTLLFQKINELINILFELEQYTLTNLSSYILFEPTLDILSRIKFLYKINNNNDNNNNSKNNFPSYDIYFLPQYELLYNFISKKGITYDNIKYLLKTLPLTDVDNIQFISYFKKIFSIFLLNFDNYYTEESFILFSLSLEKISKFIDENLFEEITLAILSKSNYKGKIFNQCYNKYNEIILFTENSKNFDFLMKKFSNSLLEYKNEMDKNKGNKILFKNKYIKFIDRIELIRKFYEYIKNNINEKNENEMWKYNIFEQKEIMKQIIDIASISDDTTISKINLLLLENLFYFDYKNNNNINKELKEEEKNNDVNKENEEINNTNTNNNYINNFTITDICMENKNNISLYSNEESKFFKNIIINNDYIYDYFNKINSKDNLYLFKENLKLMNTIIKIINNISNNYISLNEKCLLYTKYYSSINKQLILNSIKIPNLLGDLLLFYYQITIPFNYNENYDNFSNYSEYILILKEILLYVFNINNEENNNNNKQNNYNITIFGIEMLLKLFNINFNLNNISIINKIYNNDNNNINEYNISKEEIIKNKTSINKLFEYKLFSNFVSFFEKILLLLDNDNYQIFFLIEFILNLIVPQAIRENLEPIIKSLNINYVWMDNNDDLIDLFNFIKEKIINNKNINNDNNTNNSDLVGINLDDDNERDDGYVEKDIIVDEVNDTDNDMDNDSDNFNEFQEQEFKEEEINIIQQVNNMNGNDIVNQINNINNIDGREIINNLINNGNISPEVLDIIYSNTNIDNNINNFNNINNINNKNDNANNDDDDLSLEDLGVKEVDDDIFGENFDESKVPILKKNNVRCKGYAAKFKTNQNSRALLMSEHVRGNNSSNNSNSDSNNNNSINNNIILDDNNGNNNNNNNNRSNNLHFPENNQINENNNSNNILINLNKNNNILFGNNNIILNKSEEKEKTESDFNDAPDLTQKKKNIRPLNGFRPATPPLKDAYTQQNSISNTNIKNIINNNDRVNNKINDNKINNNISNNNKDNRDIRDNRDNRVKDKDKRERGKNYSISGKHRVNRSINKIKDKNIKKSSNKDKRPKSEEKKKKIIYEIKGVEIFLRKNKKIKRRYERNNKSKIKSNNSANAKNIYANNPSNTNNNKRKSIDQHKVENKLNNKEKNNNKKIENKKEKNIDEDDDIIFGEFLQLNNIENKNNENMQNKNNININKPKTYQRPNDRERKIPKDNNINNNINNNIIGNNNSNKKIPKETNINIKKNNVFSSFNEVISQKEFNNNLKNVNNNNKNIKNYDINYYQELKTPIEKKSESISFDIKQLVNESFSAKNIKNDNKLLNNFINHSGIFPSNEINNININNNNNKDRITNKSVDLFYDILNIERQNNNYKDVNNKKKVDIGGGYAYNNFFDKNNNLLNNNMYNKKGK